MNGVSGSGSSQPYLPKDEPKNDDDAVKKAASEAAKSVEKPKPHEYGALEKAADVVDLVVTTEPLLNKDIPTFFKSLASNHLNESKGHKVLEAGKEVVLERVKDFGIDGGLTVPETIGHAILQHAPIAPALHAVVMTSELATKARDIYIKTDAGLKNAQAGLANEVAAKAAVTGAMTGAEAKKADAPKTPESVVDPHKWFRAVTGK